MCLARVVLARIGLAHVGLARIGLARCRAPSRIKMMGLGFPLVPLEG